MGRFGSLAGDAAQENVNTILPSKHPPKVFQRVHAVGSIGEVLSEKGIGRLALRGPTPDLKIKSPHLPEMRRTLRNRCHWVRDGEHFSTL
jgi:hypothetical protein